MRNLLLAILFAIAIAAIALILGDGKPCVSRAAA
jgi:hypothetical protein